MPLHRLQRSWHSCPRRVNVGNKNKPSMHHPQRWNVTALMIGLKTSHICKNFTQNGEPQSWGRRRSITMLSTILSIIIPSLNEIHVSTSECTPTLKFLYAVYKTGRSAWIAPEPQQILFRSDKKSVRKLSQYVLVCINLVTPGEFKVKESGMK